MKIRYRECDITPCDYINAWEWASDDFDASWEGEWVTNGGSGICGSVEECKEAIDEWLEEMGLKR